MYKFQISASVNSVALRFSKTTTACIVGFLLDSALPDLMLSSTVADEVPNAVLKLIMLVWLAVFVHTTKQAIPSPGPCQHRWPGAGALHVAVLILVVSAWNAGHLEANAAV